MLKQLWKCGGCGAPSHEPVPDELITCVKCGINGVTPGLSVADLPRLAACAEEFYSRSKFLHGFDLSRFVAMWTGLLESGAGVIFALEHAGQITGTIGGLAYPDPYSGELIATEFFWYAREGHRGGGLKLYREFERWAIAQGCSQLRMVHLLDSMPEKLERVYRHLGFEAVETHYTKELKPWLAPQQHS